MQQINIFLIFSFTQNTSHQRTENRTDNGQGEKTAPEIASPQHIQNREKTDARREKRQTVTFKSHQRIILLEAMLFIFRQFLKPANECMSDINRWLSTVVGFWLNIHKMATYWVPPGLGQFVWAAGEQSVFYLKDNNKNVCDCIWWNIRCRQWLGFINLKKYFWIHMILAKMLLLGIIHKGSNCSFQKYFKTKHDQIKCHRGLSS